MAAETEARGRSTFAALMAVLVTLFGVSALPRVLEPPGEAPAAADDAKATPAGDAARVSNNQHLRVLQPLVDFLAAGKPGTPPGDLEGFLKKSLVDGSNPVRPYVATLIATLADPVASSNGHRFDDMLNALQRAAESRQFVLDRYRFPWARPGGAGDEASVRLGRLELRARVAPDDAGQDDPGLLVFRRWLTPEGSSSPGRPDLLLVFLVRESPVSGLNKESLYTALDLALKIDEVLDGTEGRVRGAGRRFRIVGPCFSGSQPSLGIALSGWLGANPRTPCHIEVVSGTATAIDPTRIRRGNGLPGATVPQSVDFHATVHTSGELVRTLVAHFRPLGRVALLVESNTAYGQDTRATQAGAEGERSNAPDLFPFPMHTAQLRTSYEREGLFHDRNAALLKGAERVHLHMEELNRPTDLPTAQTPVYTAAKDEQALDQTLEELDRGGFAAVGVVASDPRDVVFLVKRLREVCRGVTIFTTQSEQMFAHPQVVADLRGVYVGANYLSPTDEPRFGSDRMQGLYNAVSRLLEEAVTPEGNDHERLAGYGPPVVRGETAAGGLTGYPPIWLGRIGYGGVYPLGTFPATDAKDTAYMEPPGLPPRPVRARDVLGDFGFGAWELIWLVLTVAAVGVAVAGAGRGGNVGPGPDGLGWWLRVASGAKPEGGGWRGPGWLLPAAQGLALLVYGGYCEPLWALVAAGVLPPDWVWSWVLAAAAATGAAVWLVLAAQLGRGLYAVVARSRPGRWAWVVGPALAAVALAAWLRGTDVSGGLATDWEGFRLRALLNFDRSTGLASGLSPALPLLLLAVAGAARVAHGLRSRYVVDSALLEPHRVHEARADVHRRGLPPVGADARTLGDLGRARREVEAALHPGRGRGRSRRPGWARGPLVAAGLTAAFLAPAAAPALAAWRVRPFEALYWGAFVVLAAAVAATAAQVWWLWGRAAEVLRGVQRLPLGPTFDRTPAEVTRWFYEPVRGDGARRALVRRGAVGLAGRCTGGALRGLRAAGARGYDAHAWRALRESLDAGEAGWDLLDSEPFRNALVAAWRSFPSPVPPTRAASPAAKPAAGGVALAASPRVDTRRAARAWARQAEGLLALAWLRWLSSLVALLWSAVACAVTGVVALLLSLTSYPFPHEETAVAVLGTLAVLIAATVVRVVLALGRDPVLARVADARPGRLRFDAELLSGVLTALVPLAGLLAALSFHLAYVLRSLLDPILRYIG